MSDAPKDRLAVALRYEKPKAPRVVAVGRGFIGDKIVETAIANDVPIEKNLVLAEALAKVELEDEIPEDLYRAVAQVLSFILRASGHLR
jgi:flagellar biosynthesis protein